MRNPLTSVLAPGLSSALGQRMDNLEGARQTQTTDFPRVPAFHSSVGAPLLCQMEQFAHKFIQVSIYPSYTESASYRT
jgi:hypothetical protein